MKPKSAWIQVSQPRHLVGDASEMSTLSPAIALSAQSKLFLYSHDLGSNQFWQVFCALVGHSRCLARQPVMINRARQLCGASGIRANWDTTMTKTVLITGATAGFGAAMARRFAKAAWRVVATGRRAERLRTLVDEFGSETVAAAPFDMRDLAAINTTLSALPEPFRGIDVLVNNAGLALGTAPAPESSWRLGNNDRRLTSPAW